MNRAAKMCTVVGIQIFPSFLLCGVFKTEKLKTMNNYTHPSLAQFKYHSEVLSWKESILGSGFYTTKHDFQHFISTFLFKSSLLPQLLPSIKGKGHSISSFKAAMILQKENSQSLQISFGIFNGNQSLTCPIAGIPQITTQE